MKNFKLVQVVPSMESGGVEKGTIDLSNYLAEKNLTNFIASSGGQLLDNIQNKNIKHIKLPINSKNFFIYPFLANNLQKKINKFKINIIHFRSRAPAWLLPFLSKNNIFTVSTFHNVYGNQNFLKLYYNKQLANVDSIVAISEYVKNEIIKQYSLEEKKIAVINRGCDTEFFNCKKVNDNEIEKFINNYNIPLNKQIILFPGRITEWKGQIEFLEVVKHFKNNDFLFIFAGDCKNYSVKNKLLNKIKENSLESLCLLFDSMNYKELRILYYLSKIVISAPLKPEGFGRIVSESLAMKKVILAYNYGGVKDQLNSLNNLYKVKPLDKKELIQKINISSQINEEKYENISNESRSHVIKFFSKDQMLSKYLDLYLNL